MVVMSQCPEYKQLESEVSKIPERLAELTAQQLSAFRVRNHSLFMRLDKELELTVGEKERTVGALRQHVKEHRCLS